jgi:hypothetical protein
MKYLIATTSFVTASVVAAMAYGAQCAPADALVSKTPGTITISCLATDRCIAYELDTETGEYRNFSGYHINKCPGHAQRETMDYVCKRADGTTYAVKDVLSTSKCTTTSK